MKAARLIPIGLAAAITCAAALLVPAGASAGSSNHQYRWDIIHISGLTQPITTLPGGKASACTATSCTHMITLTGSGTFRANPGNPQDVTGVAADARAGLAVLRIAYSDGDQGVLVVSCDQPGTPTNLPIFEGITVTKGFVDYWNRVAPESVPPFGNRTTFHVLS